MFYMEVPIVMLECQSISHLLLEAEAGEVSFQSNNFNVNRWMASCQELVKGNLVPAMVCLLADPPSSFDQASDVADYYWLFCKVLAQLRYRNQQIACIKQLGQVVEWSDWRILQAVAEFKRQYGNRTCEFINDDLTQSSCGLSFPHLDFERIYSLIDLKYLDDASKKLVQIGYFDSLDSLILQAKIFFARNDLEAAEKLLLDNLAAGAVRLDFCELLMQILFRLERGDLCLPVLKKILSVHPNGSSILLEFYAQAKLLQRQPAEALRMKLLERLPKFTGRVVDVPTILSPAYDGLGRSDWFEYLQPIIKDRVDVYPDLHVNLLMHVSSHSISTYPALTTALVNYLCQHLKSLVPPFRQNLSHRHFHQSGRKSYRIGWICGDICNHPVFRFLYSWLVAVPAGSLQHQHVVAATHSCDVRYAELLERVPGVHLIDLSSHRTVPEQVKAIRALDFDLVVDLNGWTGKNIAPAFVARLALVQVNYLAYHASSGIPEMDVWLIDQYLLPQSPQLQEWHVESLLRLERPFLAWQPPDALPEGRLKVPSFSSNHNSPIRFGCFNHPRKISTQCLQAWAALMHQIPNALLVLKAFASEDTATAELLTRRMNRAGLDLERIVFLPFAATPEDHLKQYEQMDVALDSFPNTGCTTTCEALWMGVPVITLAGQHYVSRMAAAVLAAAELEEWITESVEQYLQLAVQQANPNRLVWLRNNRESWRHQVQQSPLGDAASLMQTLEATFAKLIENAIESHAA